MRIFVVSFCFLFLLASVIKAEDINLKTPISEAELLESTTSDFVNVQLTLRIAESTDAEIVAIDDFEVVGCTSIDGIKKAIGKISVDNDDKIHPTCKISVGNTDNKLRPDWNKFNLEITYRYRQNGAPFGSPLPYKGISPITRCIKVSDVTATIGVASRTGDGEITVPIKLNADIRLNVELKKKNSVTVATPNGITIATPSGKENDATVLFENDDTQKSIKLKLVNGKLFEAAPAVYEVSISQLSSQPALKIEKIGDDSFTIKPFNAYTLSVQPNDIRLIDDGSAEVSFSTTTSGSVKVLLNGGQDFVYNQVGSGRQSFTIPADRIPSGINTLNFSGQSSETDLPLTGVTIFTFNREPKTFLKETPVTFIYDNATNTLKIQFSLSRNLDTKWQFKERDGLGANTRLIDAGKNLYEASIPLSTLSPENSNLIESKFADLAGTSFKKSPVAIEIYNANRPKEIIASFEINFIKPKDNIIQKVKDAEGFITNNKLKDAAKAIAEALGFSPDNYKDIPEQKQQVEAILPQIKSGDTKSKVFKVLGVAGKIAAGLFGIPLPF